MLHIIKKQLVKAYVNHRYHQRSIAAVRDDVRWLNKLVHPDPEFPVKRLYDEEIEDVRNKWGFFPVSLNNIVKYHEIYKTYNGFDVNYVPHCCYYPYIIRVLNPDKNYEAFTNKALLEELFRGIPQPKLILRCINGQWYTSKLRPLSYEEAVSYVKSSLQTDGELIVKQATDTSLGKNIDFLPLNASDEEITNAMYKSWNKVIQVVLPQSAKTAKLNPSSLNCLRISTLNLNGRITAPNYVIKGGGKGSRVDNVGREGGGYFYGLMSDGHLTGKAYSREKCEMFSHLRGEDGLGLSLSKAIELAIEAHRHIPHLGIAGWDIALDKDDNPVMIEVNLNWPSIMSEQLANGPFFADRTDEVLEYIKLHPLIR